MSETAFSKLDYCQFLLSSQINYTLTHMADFPRHTPGDTQQVSALRWKIEEFHREAKQLTGIENCQCRKARIQRNHVACALLVWSRLKTLAYQSGQTIYQLKHGLLHDYLVQQLKNPSIQMILA